MWGEIETPVKTQPSSCAIKERSKLPDEPGTGPQRRESDAADTQQDIQQDSQVRRPLINITQVKRLEVQVSKTNAVCYNRHIGQ